MCEEQRRKATSGFEILALSGDVLSGFCFHSTMMIRGLQKTWNSRELICIKEPIVFVRISCSIPSHCSKIQGHDIFSSYAQTHCI